MKLFYSTTSPYSRKARLAIQFKHLNDQVEEITCNPFEEKPEESHQNPLGKVPTLLLSDGTPLFDSPVICEYLDGLNNNNPLYPDDKTERFKVKIAEALADGILDAAYNIVMEKRRPDGERSDTAITKWTEEIYRSIPEAEKTVSRLNGQITQAHIAIYSALGYLDFRLPEIDWRNSEQLINWFNEIETQYPSIIETKPH